MTSDIILFLIQDGIANGAIYALLGLAIVLVFAVTRIIMVPQGIFISYAALSLSWLESNLVPPTAWLLLALGLLTAGIECWQARRRPRAMRAPLVKYVVLPAALLGLCWLLAPQDLPQMARMALALALVVPFGPIMYRLAFQPVAGASPLVLLLISVAVFIALTSLGLVIFGPEGVRTAPIATASFTLGVLDLSAQSLWVVGMTALLMVLLYLFFGRTIAGKALHATAVNRIGAKLVGIETNAAGGLAFTLAAAIGALSGILISPITTIYYDTGFLMGLKGFIAAIIGGLLSYPLTVISALVIGIIESFSSFSASLYKEVIVFSLILPVLLLRSLGRRDIGEDEQ